MNRVLAYGTYTELHHIIPTCIGGKNSKDNIVALTPEEHYVAHQLLVKIYPYERNILKACHIMCNSNAKVKRNNKLYGWIRRKLSKAASTRVTVNGVIYDSILMTAKSFNISGDMVRQRCRKAKYPEWNYTDNPFIKPVAYRALHKITCDTAPYTSFKHASIVLGISVAIVRHRCLSTDYPTWNVIGAENLKTSRKDMRPRVTSKVVCGNVCFTDIYEAAEFFGMSSNGILYRFASASFYDWNFIDLPVAKKTTTIPRAVSADSRYFESVAATGKELGMTKQGIVYRCNASSFPTWGFITRADPQHPL